MTLKLLKASDAFSYSAWSWQLSTRLLFIIHTTIPFNSLPDSMLTYCSVRVVLLSNESQAVRELE